MMIRLFLRKYIRIPIIIIIGYLFLFYPYVFQKLFGIQNEIPFLLGGLLFFLIQYVLSFKKTSNIPSFLKKCILIQILFWFLFCFIHSDTSYLVRCLVILLTFLMLTYLGRHKLLFKFCAIYNVVIGTQVFLGSVAFILIFCGLLSPITTFENVDGREAYCYGLTCSNYVVGNLIRIAGYFDEPGALAYWGVFALLFNKLFINNKIVEFTLVIGLFFTLSAAYFVQIALYFIFFYFTHLKKNIIPLILMLSLVFVGFQKLGTNDVVASYTVERFAGGKIQSSRTELSMVAKRAFLKNPIVGCGAKKFESMQYMGDNPFEIPAKDGIVGLIITYLPLILVFLRYYKRKEVLFAALILSAGYLQRPFHIHILHSFMLYLFVILLYLKYKVRKKVITSIDSQMVKKQQNNGI